MADFSGIDANGEEQNKEIIEKTVENNSGFFR